jgi:uncharacterized protein YlzI (FlbEa/FlbD family)
MIEGGSNGMRITMANGSLYIVKDKMENDVLMDVVQDVVFLLLECARTPERNTLVNIDAIQVIETLFSPSITTDYHTALCLRSGLVALSEQSSTEVEQQIIELSRKD